MPIFLLIFLALINMVIFNKKVSMFTCNRFIIVTCKLLNTYLKKFSVLISNLIHIDR